MNPIVLTLIVCEDVRTDEANLHRIDVFGIIFVVRSKANPRFPVIHPMLKLLVAMTNCHGVGTRSVRIVQEATGKVICLTRPKPMQFVGEPDDVVAFVIKIRDTTFPAPGVYWIEFLYSGAVLARQRLLLKG